MTLRTRLRDWWRGYSDADIASAIEKAGHMVRAGVWVDVTDGEMKAIYRGASRKPPKFQGSYEFGFDDPRTWSRGRLLADWLAHGGKL